MDLYSIVSGSVDIIFYVVVIAVIAGVVIKKVKAKK